MNLEQRVNRSSSFRPHWVLPRVPGWDSHVQWVNPRFQSNNDWNGNEWKFSRQSFAPSHSSTRQHFLAAFLDCTATYDKRNNNSSWKWPILGPLWNGHPIASWIWALNLSANWHLVPKIGSYLPTTDPCPMFRFSAHCGTVWCCLSAVIETRSLMVLQQLELEWCSE